MRVLMIGDVIGRPGRWAVAEVLPGLRRDLDLNVVTANGENAAGGFGITPDTAKELFEAGVNVITSGNHVWDQRAIIPYLDVGWPILRPLNYPPSVPGKGFYLLDNLLVVNIMGRVFMQAIDCPFRAMDQLIGELGGSPKVIIVDFHAEATSEKQAMGWYLDGRATAVIGTHTHVPTIDLRILPNGTGYASDAGMVGPKLSVIGSDPQIAIQRLLTQTPHRLSVPSTKPIVFNSVLIEVDDATGKVLSLSRVDREVE